jgi:transposase
MRMAIPPLREQVDELQQRLQREHDGQKKPRLQLLSRLASGQAGDRQAVASRLGVPRHTIGRWLALYAAKGLDALLATYVPAGKPVALAPAVLASREPALRRPEGFASYEALRQWVAQTHHVQVNDTTLSTIVRTRFRTKLKVPRPSHTQKSGGHSRLPGDLSDPPPARYAT